MPLKKTDKGRSLELVFELPGTPEQVWQAIATGPGISAWFVPSEVEERAGGAVLFHLGEGMDARGTVTVWQPLERFAYEEPGWSGEAPPLATEMVVEAQRGGTCTLRLVHSLFTTADDWDDELGSMERGWPPFIHVLRAYLEQFAGQSAASIRVLAKCGGPADAAFSRLLGRLGLSDLRQGGRARTQGEDVPALSGIVQCLSYGPEQELLVRLDEPATGIAVLGAGTWQDEVHVAMSIYFYGRDARSRVDQHAPEWQRCFKRLSDATDEMAAPA